MNRWLWFHRRGFVLRWRHDGPGVRLLLGPHTPLYAERHGTLVHAWHRKRFCLAALASWRDRDDPGRSYVNLHAQQIVRDDALRPDPTAHVRITGL